MIEISRLILRPWRPSDRAPFAEQNADPVVMRYLLNVLTGAESDNYVDRIEQHLAETGYCKWAVEAPRVAPFIGAVGLSRVKFEASFTPAVEVAWRLHRRFWGFGYATEAARAAIADGFTRAKRSNLPVPTDGDCFASLACVDGPLDAREKCG